MGNRRSRLAHRRKTTGYSQDELAERLGVERSTVVRWEAARSDPQPWVRPKLAAALNISPDELGILLHDETPGPIKPERHVRFEPENPSSSDVALAPPAESPTEFWSAHSTDDTVHVHVCVEGSEVDVPLDRRSLLRAGLTVALGTASAFGPEPVVNRARQSAHALTAAEIDDLVAHLREQWHLLVKIDNLLGPRYALASVREHLAALGDVLPTTRGQARQEVVQLAAKYAESASWLHEDAGESVEAERLIRQAMEWSQEADDRAMLAWTLFRRSNQAASQGDGAKVISLAQAAQRNDPAVSSPMRAALAQQLAHGYALDGDEVAAQRQLAHAMAWATTDTAGDAREGHGSFCTETYIELQRAHCWLRLDRPERAVQVYETALPTLPAAYRRDRGVSLANFAAACVGADEPERAAQVGTEALSIARSSGSVRTEHRVAEVAQRLTTNSALQSVARLLDELHTSSSN